MNQQLQTKAMALLTALLQGASPVERKVSVDQWLDVDSTRWAPPPPGRNNLSPLSFYPLSTCLIISGRGTFASSSIR